MTIAEIAAELGVSKTTVSRSISGNGRIGEGTRERVLAYIKEHDYRPNAIARSLAKSKTYNLGVVMPRDYCLSDFSFFLNCLSGLHEIAAAEGYDILLLICDNENMTSLERVLDDGKVDGIILMRTFRHDNAVRLLKNRKVPFITIGSTEEPDVMQVDQDHEAGCRELTAALLAKGLERIALIGGDEEFVVTQKRRDGYIRAFRDAKKTVDLKLIYQDQDNMAQIGKTIDRLLKKQVDCIICMDDNICKMVLEQLRNKNIAVPQDIKVASFFDSAFLEDNNPSITSLKFNTKETGMAAGQTLINLIRGNQVQQQTLRGYQLSFKDSTK